MYLHLNNKKELTHKTGKSVKFYVKSSLFTNQNTFTIARSLESKLALHLK